MATSLKKDEEEMVINVASTQCRPFCDNNVKVCDSIQLHNTFIQIVLYSDQTQYRKHLEFAARRRHSVYARLDEGNISLALQDAHGQVPNDAHGTTPVCLSSRKTY
jgi:hypothetical protein